MRGWGRSCRLDHDGAEIIHIGQGGTGHHRISQRFKEAMTVVVSETVLGFYPQRPSTLQRVRGEAGSGDLLLTVDSIGITGQCVDAWMSTQSNAQSQ